MNVDGFAPNWLYGQENAGLGIYIAPGRIGTKNYPGGVFSVPNNATTLFWVDDSGVISSGPTGVHPIASVVSGPVATGTGPSFIGPFRYTAATTPGILSITDLRVR